MEARKKNKKTDWDAYYSKPFKLSGYSRQITINLILRLFSVHGQGAKKICELGGANSCIYSALHNRYPLADYLVVDNNAKGMSLLESLQVYGGGLELLESNILENLPVQVAADVVFSLGLIEHFNPYETAVVIRQHFVAAKPDSLIVITFPTPTWLYRCSRKIAEWLGLWIFHDERPLQTQSVKFEMEKYGMVVESFINWKIFFTQGVIAVKAKRTGQDALAVEIGEVL